MAEGVVIASFRLNLMAACGKNASEARTTAKKEILSQKTKSTEHL